MELRCDVPMLRRLWQRIVERHRRNIADLEQIEIEMAKEDSHFPLLPPFPEKPYKVSTIALHGVRIFRRCRGRDLLCRATHFILPLRNRVL